MNHQNIPTKKIYTLKRPILIIKTLYKNKYCNTSYVIAARPMGYKMLICNYDFLYVLGCLATYSTHHDRLTLCEMICELAMFIGS